MMMMIQFLTVGSHKSDEMNPRVCHSVQSRPVPRMSGVLGMLENKELATLLIRNKQQHAESKARHGSTSYWSFSIRSLNIRSVSETWTGRRTPSITR